MSLLTELFGVEILNATLQELKNEINYIAPAEPSKRAALLNDFATIKGIELTAKDYEEIGV